MSPTHVRYGLFSPKLLTCERVVREKEMLTQVPETMPDPEYTLC